MREILTFGIVFVDIPKVFAYFESFIHFIQKKQKKSPQKSDYEIFPVLKSEITAKSKLKREKFIDKCLSLFS